MKKSFKLSLLLIPLILVAIFWQFNLVLNLTPSLPIGIWQVKDPLKDSIQRGDLVVYCYKGDITLSFDSLYCKNHGIPLLKKVAGLPNDIIVIEDSGITINGRRINNSVRLSQTKDGQPLTKIAPAQIKLKPGQYWLMNDHQLSFDSRYFGVVEWE